MYLTYLSALLACTLCILSNSHFPDYLGSLATSAGKTHSEIKEHTDTHNITHSVNGVSGSDDGS